MRGEALAPSRCIEAGTRPAALRTPRPHMQQPVQPQIKVHLDWIPTLAPVPVRVLRRRRRLERYLPSLVERRFLD